MHIKLLTKYYFINTLDTNNLQKQDRDTIIIYRNYSSSNIKISKLIKFPNSYSKKNLTIDTKQDYLRVKNFFDKTNDPIKTSWNKILN